MDFVSAFFQLEWESNLSLEARFKRAWEREFSRKKPDTNFKLHLGGALVCVFYALPDRLAPVSVLLFVAYLKFLFNDNEAQPFDRFIAQVALRSSGVKPLCMVCLFNFSRLKTLDLSSVTETRIAALYDDAFSKRLDILAQRAEYTLTESDLSNVTSIFDALNFESVAWHSWISEKLAIEPLPIKMEKLILGALSQSDVGWIGPVLEKECLTDVVEHNPKLITRFLELLWLEDPDVALIRWERRVAELEPSLTTLQMVTTLSVRVSFSQDFFHLFLANLINACSLEKSDKSQKLRLVKLTCVFIAAGIKSKFLQPLAEYALEIQAFCIEHSRVKEASSLFKLLKEKT